MQKSISKRFAPRARNHRRKCRASGAERCQSTDHRAWCADPTRRAYARKLANQIRHHSELSAEPLPSIFGHRITREARRTWARETIFKPSRFTRGKNRFLAYPRHKLSNRVHRASQFRPMSHSPRQCKCAKITPRRETLNFKHKNQFTQDLHTTKYQLAWATANDHRLVHSTTSLNYILNAAQSSQAHPSSDFIVARLLR